MILISHGRWAMQIIIFEQVEGFSVIVLRSVEKLIPPQALHQFRETGVNRAWTGNIEHRLAFDIWKALKRRTEMSRIASEMPPIPTESEIPPSNPRKRRLPSVYTSKEAKAILIERDNAKKGKLLVRNKEHALNRPLMNIHDKE
jgi:hypothetical protein